MSQSGYAYGDRYAVYQQQTTEYINQLQDIISEFNSSIPPISRLVMNLSNVYPDYPPKPAKVSPSSNVRMSAAPTSTESNSQSVIRPGNANQHPDAYIYGIGTAISLPPRNSINVGIELMVLHKDHVGIDRSGLFVYSGGGATFGAGGNLAVYTGRINNLQQLDDYTGHARSTGGTISVGGLGLTVSQFGNPLDATKPFGWIYGWAPGARLSGGGTTTEYWRIPGW